ncbi:MAG TPA: hypothetical protein VGM37_01400 [Armatimonadota bacterium]|jgi:hypothetical protein
MSWTEYLDRCESGAVTEAFQFADGPAVTIKGIDDYNLITLLPKRAKDMKVLYSGAGAQPIIVRGQPVSLTEDTAAAALQLVAAVVDPPLTFPEAVRLLCSRASECGRLMQRVADLTDTAMTAKIESVDARLEADPTTLHG